MNLYQRILGTPFVYNQVRPLVVGGIDMSPFYQRVQAGDADTVLDVGCGTGDALRYLDGFARYEGIDTDEVAIGFAKKTYGERPRVNFQCRMCTDDDVRDIQPSHVMLCGVLHHMPDDVVQSLFGMVKKSPNLRRIVTSDIVFLEGETVSNFLAGLDRGKFCRQQAQYRELVERSGLRVAESAIVKSHPTRGLAKYLMMTIEP